MNIIKVDLIKIEEMINTYRINTLNLYSTNEKIEYENPIVLMNSNTLEIIKSKNHEFLNLSKLTEINKKYSSTIFGCNIAIAEWLPFGEVVLK